MSEQDLDRNAETDEPRERGGSHAADARHPEDPYGYGVRTDDDDGKDPQRELEDRLKHIEDEQRQEREGEDDAPDRDGDGGANGAADEGDDGGADGGADDGADGGADDDADRATRGITPADEVDDESGTERNDDPEDTETEEEKRAREEAFAAEHDPADHDLSAGEEFRQAGDWTADDGKLTEDDVVHHDDDGGENAGGSSQGGGDGDSDGRRVAGIDEIRDGGYGVGSAAPIDDGAMPMDHPVKAWEDAKTYLNPGEEGYAEVNPDVWFLSGHDAERCGFHHGG